MCMALRSTGDADIQAAYGNQDFRNMITAKSTKPVLTSDTGQVFEGVGEWALSQVGSRL